VTEQQTPSVTDLQTNKHSESVSSTQIAIEREGEEVNKTTKLQNLKDTDLQSTELPKYLKLERKEARLRQDQIDALTDLTRKLNRTKRLKGGERLTDNTLIRVAVDLLLSKASELQGTTEDELRSSLNL
jgi:predicted ATPase with chaperone activity